VLGMEMTNGLCRAGDQRGWRVTGELHQCQFRRVVTQRGGLVEHPGPLALGLLQQVGGVEVLAVERRILAHDDGVKVLERFAPLVGHVVPVIGQAGEMDLPHQRGHWLPPLPLQVLGLAGGHGVTAPLQLAHHGKGGVLVDLETGQRIGHK